MSLTCDWIIQTSFVNQINNSFEISCSKKWFIHKLDINFILFLKQNFCMPFLLYLYGTYGCLKASVTIHFKYMENQSMEKKFEGEIFL